MTLDEFFDQLTIINMKKDIGENIEGMRVELFERLHAEAYKEGYAQAQHDAAEIESFLNRVDWERA